MISRNLLEQCELLTSVHPGMAMGLQLMRTFQVNPTDSVSVSGDDSGRAEGSQLQRDKPMSRFDTSKLRCP